MVGRVEFIEGYKKTEIGIIPVDWELIKLGDYSDITKLAGFEYSKYFNSYKDGGEITVIRGTNLTKNKLDLSDVKKIPRQTSNMLKRSQLNKNDLVFAYVGTIGPVYLITESNRYHLGPNTAKITLKCEILSNYAFVYFTSKLIRKEIKYHTSIGAQPSLSMTKIRKFNIILPPLDEQKAIAIVLTDMDNLIQSLEKMIDKKKKIKQGTMQQLLTGKKRLPGFSGEWSVDCIKNIADISTGSRNTQDKVDGGEYPLYVRSSVIERINSYSFDGEAVLTAGDGVGTGKIFHYVNGKFDIHQRVYKISDFCDHVDGYYFYLYFSANFFGRIMAMTAKSSVDSVRMEMIVDMEIPLPKLKEQIMIGSIIRDMDSEIESLKHKLEKYKSIKHGMMQELLTGRIRLL